ncbi:uncharacterized protein V1513DRAFT_454945, partial [Lipomyces chichibuensis]|uniref:uncharacterized protein n=1 Tax=Lipomyces chichibuensis TaxID=1546026 RepID=UPI003343543A
MFQRLKPLAVEAKSDDDRYFDSPQIGIDIEATDDTNGYSSDARDFLAIPASEVLRPTGVRKHSLQGEMMRMLMIILA